MPTMDELRSRSTVLFSNLLAPRAAAPRATAAPERTFRWFDPDDAADAVAIAAHLAIVSAAEQDEANGLERAWTSLSPGPPICHRRSSPRRWRSS